MGVFTRFRDIISSNINAMLDRAEDPEKLIRLMIREMEDTLVELKAACAGVMATRKKIQRQIDGARSRETLWEDRARLAVEKGHDNLAREALQEKRRFTRIIQSLESELSDHQGLVAQYQDDIRQLDEKLTKAREKQRVLAQRHIRAMGKRKAQEEIRRVDSYETVAKFDDLENRIERMEAEADLADYGRKPTLEEAFEKLYDDDIEKELDALKTINRENGDNGEAGQK
jgi:phage shock protein A